MSGSEETVEVSLRAMDVDVVVELTGTGAAELAPLVRAAWSRCLASRAEQSAEPDVRVPISHAAGGDPGPALDALSPAVTVAAIDHQAGRRLMLHACGLADPTSGRTVAMVGPSGTGKTTAARLLGRRFGYVTDETVAIRADSTVAAYPKPLSLKVDGSYFKQQVDVDDLAATPASLVLHKVVVLRRDGAAEPWLEPVPVLEALAALAAETSYLSRMPRPLHRIADLLGSTGGLDVLHYADAEQLPDVVATLVGDHPGGSSGRGR